METLFPDAPSPASFTSQTPTPVTCVLLNWNGAADTIACLRSLALQDYPALHILVVDNGSTDNSVAAIRAAFPNVDIIEAGANLGFARGNNLGIRRAVAAGAAYVWLLNNDTIAPPDTCSKLVAKARATPNAGLIGSVLYFMHDPSRIQAWGGGNLIVWLARSTHFHRPTPLVPTSYLTFASVLIPRPVLESVGVLYEGSFMYWDDADLSLRVTCAGYALAVAEDTAILHKEGGSSTHRSPLIDRYAVASGLHFLRRHSRVPGLSMVLFLAIKFTSRALRGRFTNARAVLHGITDYRRRRHTAYSDRL